MFKNIIGKKETTSHVKRQNKLKNIYILAENKGCKVVARHQLNKVNGKCKLYQQSLVKVVTRDISS